MPATVFTDPIFPGAKIITASLTVTNTSGSYSTTVTDDRMTGSMKAISLEIDDPSIFNAKISVNATAGQYTFSCSDVAGSTTVVISFVKTADDPTELTSSEFDVLNNRIGDLTTLTTTAKTSAVAAINEVDDHVATINTTLAALNVKAYNITIGANTSAYIPAISGTSATYLVSSANNTTVRSVYRVIRVGSNLNVETLSETSTVNVHLTFALQSDNRIKVSNSGTWGTDMNVLVFGGV